MEAIKAIKADIFLETANFKLPTSFLLHETYPLPPLSTVVGMIHAICGFTEYHDMKIGIAGTSSGTYTEAGITYSFKPNGFDSDRIKNYGGGIFKSKNGKATGIYRGLGHSEIISNLTVVLYVIPEMKDFDAVLDGLRSPKVFPALGRHDDIVRINSVETVNLEKARPVTIDEDRDCLKAPMDMYVDKAACFTASGVGGTTYALHKQFRIENGVRRWADEYDVTILKQGGELNDFEGNCEYMTEGTSLVCLF